MRILKLITFGAIGTLGILRGTELIVFANNVREALVPLLFGVIFAALFFQEWKKK